MSDGANRHVFRPMVSLLYVLITIFSIPAFTQDTIQLEGQTIRVGELEWEMYKGWTGKDFAFAENEELYGKHVTIYIGFHRSRTVREIVFGHFASDTAAGITDFLAQGPARYYDPQGRLVGKRYFSAGELHGPFEDYHPTGRLSAKGKYVNGKLQGDYVTYYESGELQCKTPFVDDQEQGTEWCYHRNGKPQSRLFYEAGKPEGPDSSWYDNGALEATYLFSKGMEQDTGHHWHSNGAPFTDRIFLQGKLVQVLFVKDKEGKDLDPGDFSNGRGNVNIYSDEGKLKEIVNYRDGYVRKVKYIE